MTDKPDGEDYTREVVDLEVVQLLGGPGSGECAEAPVDYPEIWRYCDGTGYCLYRRTHPLSSVFAFAHEIEQDAQRMAERIERDYGAATNPYIHADRKTPRDRRVTFTKYAHHDD